MVSRAPDMVLTAYALSRLGEAGANGKDAPPSFLGASGWAEAYDLFYPLFSDGRTPQSFRNSLKNARDAFDAYGTTQRTGWRKLDGTPPEPKGAIKAILTMWEHRPDDELRELVKNTLARLPSSGAAPLPDDWANARSRIERTTRNTVKQSGKKQTRWLKNKELRCTDLGRTLDVLIARQSNRCAQTGIEFIESDPELRASLDRIDSDGHYADGTMDDGPHNLQLVTHWYNMAKSVRSDAAMRRLLAVHASSMGEMNSQSERDGPADRA